MCALEGKTKTKDVLACEFVSVWGMRLYWCTFLGIGRPGSAENIQESVHFGAAIMRFMK